MSNKPTYKSIHSHIFTVIAVSLPLHQASADCSSLAQTYNQLEVERVSKARQFYSNDPCSPETFEQTRSNIRYNLKKIEIDDQLSRCPGVTSRTFSLQEKIRSDQDFLIEQRKTCDTISESNAKLKAIDAEISEANRIIDGRGRVNSGKESGNSAQISAPIRNIPPNQQQQVSPKAVNPYCYTIGPYSASWMSSGTTAVEVVNISCSDPVRVKVCLDRSGKLPACGILTVSRNRPDHWYAFNATGSYTHRIVK